MRTPLLSELQRMRERRCLSPASLPWDLSVCLVGRSRSSIEDLSAPAADLVGCYFPSADTSACAYYLMQTSSFHGGPSHHGLHWVHAVNSLDALQNPADHGTLSRGGRLRGPAQSLRRAAQSSPTRFGSATQDAVGAEQAPRGLSPLTENFAEEEHVSEGDAGSVVSNKPPGTDDDAREFVKELNHEMLRLDAPVHSHRLRRFQEDITRDLALHRAKGMKLDFKQVDAIQPTLKFCHDKQVTSNLDGYSWLNADVFAGPGNLMSPFEAKEFVKLCAKGLPEAVLSLSWGSCMISATRLYRHEMVDSIVSLFMSPMVPRKVSAMAAWTAT